MAVPVPDPVASPDCPLCGKRRGSCVHFPAAAGPTTRPLPPLPVVDQPPSPPLPVPGSEPGPFERCELCGGRHSEALRRDGRRALIAREIALHLDTTEEQVYKWIKAGALVTVPNRGPRQTAVEERNVMNHKEGRPQQLPGEMPP